MEPELASEESGVFTAKVTETRHLNAGANATEPAIEHPSPQYAARLNAVPGYAQTVGPTLSLAVRKGDVIKAQVQAYYEAATDNNTLPSQSLVPSIVAAFAGTGIVDGQVIQSALNAASGSIAVGSVLKTDNNYLPHAYLNYILFDENFVYVDAGYQRVTTAANTAHETLSREITASENGYIFVYVSNESKWDVNVFFDDIKVEHEHIDIVQHDDYYPFGLAFNQSADRQLKNKYLYNGKELQDELGLDWYHYGSRYYDPALGRWHVVDPLASDYVYNSPYAFSENHVTAHIELEGLEKVFFQEGLNNNSVYSKSYSIQRQTTGGKDFQSKLKNQNTYNVLYAIHSYNYSDGRVVDIDNFDDFNQKQQSASYPELKSIKGTDIKQAIEDGKKVVLILLNKDRTQSEKMTKQGARDLNHEEVSHASDVLDGNLRDAYEDHEFYYGEKSGTSPSDHQIETNPKYSNSVAKKQYDEIDKIIKEQKIK